MLITQRVNRSSIVGKNEKSKSSWNISCSLQSFLSCDGGDGMKYTFTITDEKGVASEIQEMSWKKLLKRLAGKTCWVSYINKKGNSQTKVVENGKEKRD